ncbi:MAG: sulfurtransferase TusA family protein [Thermoproteota archaeon]
MSENADNQENRKLDMKGLFCPEPVFRTKQTIQEMKINETLEVVADDPAAEEDIRSWVKKSGNELISLKKDDSDIKFTIRKVK